LELLDVQGQQPQVAMVPIKYSDAKSISDKVRDILQVSKSKSSKGSSYHSYKILTDERSNSVVVFGPPRTIKDIRALVKKFDIQLEDPSRQASIHVRPLDYADAKKLAATLSALASSGSSKSSLRRPPSRSSKRTSSKSSKPALADLGDGVKITADESSNSLLITGSRAAYEAVNSIIRKLDIRRSQVYVEADILDISTTNDFKFGTSIFAGKGAGNSNKIITAWEAKGMTPLLAAQAAAASGTATGATTLRDAAGVFASDMTIGILSGTAVTVPGLGTFSPGALIKMLKADANTKILSSPHILTSNNEEAVISVGETIFFQSGDVSGGSGIAVATPKVEKEKAALTLSIKPNISHSSYVTLNIDLEADTIDGIDPITKLPKLNNRKSKQIVTARNGQTIVISGLVSNTEYESFSKIPLLGDIPILGWLFRNSITKSIKKNLSIFLTPHVIHGADDLALIYKTKIKERDEFLKNVYGQSGVEDDFYVNLPTESDGKYRPTPLDKDEQERIRKFKQETYKEMGYGNMAKYLEKEYADPSVDEEPAPVPVDPTESTEQQDEASSELGSTRNG
jgi:general secretion pathway protein D